MTYKQAQAQGWQVRGGERSTPHPTHTTALHELGHWTAHPSTGEIRRSAAGDLAVVEGEHPIMNGEPQRIPNKDYFHSGSRQTRLHRSAILRLLYLKKYTGCVAVAEGKAGRHTYFYASRPGLLLAGSPCCITPVRRRRPLSCIRNRSFAVSASGSDNRPTTAAKASPHSLELWIIKDTTETSI
jgi:hypothetical protein